MLGWKNGTGELLGEGSTRKIFCGPKKSLKKGFKE
jgi:hypothetical protein